MESLDCLYLQPTSFLIKGCSIIVPSWWVVGIPWSFCYGVPSWWVVGIPWSFCYGVPSWWVVGIPWSFCYGVPSWWVVVEWLLDWLIKRLFNLPLILPQWTALLTVGRDTCACWTLQLPLELTHTWSIFSY